MIKQESGKELVYGVLAAGYKNCKEIYGKVHALPHFIKKYTLRASEYVNIRDPWIMKFLLEKVEDLIIEGKFKFKNLDIMSQWYYYFIYTTESIEIKTFFSFHRLRMSII